jgi:hypothetical protein
MGKKLIAFVAGIGSMTLAPSMGEAAVPKQLYNKTVRVNWAQSMVMKLLAEGRQISATPRFERTIYISSAGRLFVRGHAVGQGRTTPTRTTERGPEQSGSTTSFQGNTIVNFAQRPGDSVATRLTISFDPSFSSCTASVNVGKLGPNPKITGIDGSPRELIDVSASTPSCAISEGNALGQ